jgi:prepilin-type N-terminal cleavage/methylation domain-containing protein
MYAVALPRSKSALTAGFTLIELSIVLVIIGLIIGGILVGQDLMNAAAIRAQIAQIDKYNTAVNAFKLKFNALPGDMNAATATAFGFTARGAFAGQGDGNGVIEGVWGNGASSNYGSITFGGETQIFWVDLTTANMVDGGFSQNNMLARPASVTAAQVSLYYPAAKIGNGNYIFVWSGGWLALAGVQGKSDGVNYFSLEAVVGSPAGLVGVPAANTTLTVQQAYNIDSKIDDGLPQSGRVMAMYLAKGWACGGANDPVGGQQNSGDFDNQVGSANYLGPITPQTVTPYYSHTTGGVAFKDTCYNNGDTLASEHYSMEYNGGRGQNCMLSFKFQ